MLFRINDSGKATYVPSLPKATKASSIVPEDSGQPYAERRPTITEQQDRGDS
ncbi:MAG: hypothetical protein SF182_28910 [Deltaproteobacteria bacterium]|nr:hypothetical protein [Deltaproteobacteria bacterium]